VHNFLNEFFKTNVSTSDLLAELPGDIARRIEHRPLFAKRFPASPERSSG
jgi:hypothetical protein